MFTLIILKDNKKLQFKLKNYWKNSDEEKLKKKEESVLFEKTNKSAIRMSGI